jgi:hypothetical protein
MDCNYRIEYYSKEHGQWYTYDNSFSDKPYEMAFFKSLKDAKIAHDLIIKNNNSLELRIKEVPLIGINQDFLMDCREKAFAKSPYLFE